MTRPVSVSTVLLMSAWFSLVDGDSKLCPKFAGYVACTNYDSGIRIATYTNIWSGFRCKALCLGAADCQTYFIRDNGYCSLYRNGCIPYNASNIQRFDLEVCRTVVNEPYNARVDTWDEQFEGLVSLYKWYSSGGLLSPPVETNFLNFTFPYEATDYDKRVSRMQASYRCLVDSAVTLKVIIQPTGIFTYDSLLYNKTIVLNVTTALTDGSFSVEHETWCKRDREINFALLVATKPETLKMNMQVKTANGNYEPMSTSSLKYVECQKPLIVMNQEQVYEASNEIVLLKPTIIGSYPINGHWIFNGIRVTDTPSAILIDTRFNQSAYGLYKLYVENLFGTDVFHFLVKPPFEELFVLRRYINPSRSRMQSVQVSHRFSGQNLSSEATFSESNLWSATLTDVRLAGSNKTQLKVLQTNTSRFGGLTLSAVLEFESATGYSLWTDTWYDATYNYSLIANGKGYLGGIISFSHTISDSIVWVLDLNTSISENLKPAKGCVSVQFEDKALNGREGQYPLRMSFNVTIKLALDEGSNSPLYDVLLAPQVPTNFIDILKLTPITSKCFCDADVLLSRGLAKLRAKTLNIEEEIQVQLTLIATAEQAQPVPIWITYGFRASEKSNSPEIYYQTAKVYINNEINLALKKMASHSSQYYWFASAYKAVDGNLNAKLFDGSCTHTNQGPNPWWQVDLDYQTLVKKIVIYNRMDDVPERLSNARATVGSNPNGANNQLCGQAGSTAGVPIVTLDCPASLRGRYVWISIEYGFLALCEVQVLGSYAEDVNLALRKPATQSSLHPYDSTLVASNAVDGNTNVGSSGQLCSHTDMERNPWWQVDLEYRSFIQRVIIYRAQDCCKQCLNNIKVTVSYDPTGATNDLCGTIQNETSVNRTEVICPRKLQGRYIRLSIPFGILTVCEVQAIGSYFDHRESAFSMSYVMSANGTFFFACTRTSKRRESLCVMTDNQGRSWKVLPSKLYDIRGFDVQNGLLSATDAQQNIIHVNVNDVPWKMRYGEERSTLTTAQAVYLDETQACENEIQMLTTQVGSKYWMITRDGIQESGFYILRW